MDTSERDIAAICHGLVPSSRLSSSAAVLCLLLLFEVIVPSLGVEHLPQLPIWACRIYCTPLIGRGRLRSPLFAGRGARGCASEDRG